MSSFKDWIDTVSDDVLPEYDTFASETSDNDRQLGFRAGRAAQSKYVNAGLRQANLVAKALMDLADINGTANFRSSADDVKLKISAYLQNGSYLRTATSYEDIPYGICVNYAKSAKNAILDSSNRNITDTFNGILGRLNNLGFKSGSVSREETKTLIIPTLPTDPSSSKVYKQGKVVSVHLRVDYSNDDGQTYPNTQIGKIAIDGETDVLTQQIQFTDIHFRYIVQNYSMYKYTYTIETDGDIYVKCERIATGITSTVGQQFTSQRTHTIVSNFKDGENTIYYS